MFAVFAILAATHLVIYGNQILEYYSAKKQKTPPPNS
jgi:hypothetical protein